MNLSLLDPFAVATEYPDSLETILNSDHSLVIKFSHKGDYLASGLASGSIVIYDLMASAAVVATISDQGHTRPITSLSWSKCGRYILSSSQDWKCILWDLDLVNRSPLYSQQKTFNMLQSPSVKIPDSHIQSPAIRVITFDSPIWLASMHPCNVFQFTASLIDESAVFVDMSNISDVIIRELPTYPEWHPPTAAQATGSDVANDYHLQKDKHFTLVTAFLPNSGAFIFTGTSKGFINVFDTATLTVVYRLRATTANIKNLVFASTGRTIAINLSDRIIRQYTLPDLEDLLREIVWDELEMVHKYQDVVNRLQWNSVLFNHNGDFLVASAYGTSSHDLYVWETSLGSLIKILEGSTEELVDVQWNHRRCAIGATGIDLGMVYMWQVKFPQKWSALAPDFVEVEECIEYEEREDEFDELDDAQLHHQRLQAEEDAMVDIVTPEPVDARGFVTLKNSFTLPVRYR